MLERIAELDKEKAQMSGLMVCMEYIGVNVHINCI